MMYATALYFELRNKQTAENMVACHPLIPATPMSTFYVRGVQPVIPLHLPAEVYVIPPFHPLTTGPLTLQITRIHNSTFIKSEGRKDLYASVDPKLLWQNISERWLVLSPKSVFFFF